MFHIYLFCHFPRCYWDWNSAYIIQIGHLVQPCSWLLICVVVSSTMSNIREILIAGICAGLSSNLIFTAELGNLSWTPWQTLQYKFTDKFAVSEDVAESMFWVGMITAVEKSSLVRLYLQNQLHHCGCDSACPCLPWQCNQGKSN